MTTFWSESWTGPNGAAWPREWFTGGQGTATIESNRGRLTSGPGAYAFHRSRLVGMGDVLDQNVVLSFTPAAAGEQYLTVGVRTPSNEALPRGMYAQVYDFLGPGVWLFRVGYDDLRLNLVSTTSGLPASFAAGVTYKVRFLVQGKRLRVRVWAASGAEPGTWALDYTDPDAYMGPGKATIAYTNGGAGANLSMDVDDLHVLSLDPVEIPLGEPVQLAEWTAWSRAADYSPDVALPIASIKGVEQHLGVDAVVLETEYTEERWLSLQPSRGLILNRNGRQKFTGRMRKRTHRFDRETGRLRIRVEAVSEEDRFGKALVFPDPLRAADDQTVNDYWMTRVAGVATAKVASTAMMQLISDQAGPTCRVDRRIPGLVLGADPAVGTSRIWSGLFTSAGERGVLDQLAAISAASGENLGVRITSAAGALTVGVVQPRDLADSVRFSADLGNLVGYEYSEEEPDCTDAVAAGQGDLHLRLRKHITTASAFALSWAIKAWKYIDRRDTADVAELTKAATDAVTEGDAKVSLAVTLTDSQAATYDVDWALGDVITIYVAPPGQATTVTVSDVVREVVFEVDDKGVETITPAIGTLGASSLPDDDVLKRLTTIGSALGGLVSRK